MRTVHPSRMIVPLMILLIFTTVETVADDAPAPPNILWIVSDDQRADTIGALGNEQIQTPSLDRLVRQGIRFNSAYCMGSTSGAVCAPSRYMMMTGRSLHRLPGNVFNIPESEVTLPQRLREAGWNTFFTGKWHNGPASYARSFSDGAEIFFGGMDDHWNVPAFDHDPTGKYEGRLPQCPDAFRSNDVKIRRGDHVTAGKHSSELFAEAAMDYLDEYDSDDVKDISETFTLL